MPDSSVEDADPLVKGKVEAGYHGAQFDAGGLASGADFDDLRTPGFFQTR